MTDANETEQLREQIDHTRAELGDTVEALAAKTDVKAQAKRKLERTHVSPLPIAAGTAVLGGMLVARVVKRRRAAKRREASTPARVLTMLQELSRSVGRSAG